MYSTGNPSVPGTLGWLAIVDKGKQNLVPVNCQTAKVDVELGRHRPRLMYSEIPGIDVGREHPTAKFFNDVSIHDQQSNDSLPSFFL